MIAYVNNGFDTEVKHLTREQLDAILTSGYQKQLVDRIRQEPDHDQRSALKVKLRAILPMGYPDLTEYQRYRQAYQQLLSRIPDPERAAWLKQNKLCGLRKIEFFQPSHLFMIDIDHQENAPRQLFANICQTLQAQQLPLQGFLAWAYITASGDGLRLILKGRSGSDIVKDQCWFADLCGLPHDAACKDITRLSFLTTQEDTLYRDDSLLFGSVTPVYTNAKFGGMALLPPVQKRLSEEPATVIPAAAPVPSDAEPAGVQPSAAFPQQYHGFTFPQILDAYWKVTNHGHVPTQGDRDSLTYRLACDLRHICGNNFEWLNAVIPCYDHFPQHQKESKIRRALASTYEVMPGRITRVMEYLESHSQKSEAGFAAHVSAENSRVLPDATDIPAPEEDQEDLPPQMPEHLPGLIQLLTSCTPDIYKPAVAHAVFPSLATHLHEVKFRYIDNVLHEATLMNILMAGTGAGKDCITEPINRIMADIRVRDHMNLDRERRWKEEFLSKGANKDKKRRPDGLVIQEIDADMTNPAFVMRTAEADGHFLYSKLNELEQFDALKGSIGQQFQIMCLAFDPNNRYGQTRVGVQSVTEKVQIRYNWNACTTIAKGKRYFRHVLTDGPISRINFCTIPERPIGAPLPVYGNYTREFDEALEPYVQHLCAASGTVDCPQAYDLTLKLLEECTDRAQLTQSRVYENLTYRALVIAWLKGCVLYVANGYRWEEEMDAFIRWSLHYDLWCKMEFFGEDIAEENQRFENQKRHHRRQNLLEQLPGQFTMTDALMLRRQQNLSDKGTRDMIYQWIHRKYIERIGKDLFRKCLQAV